MEKPNGRSGNPERPFKYPLRGGLAPAAAAAATEIATSATAESAAATAEITAGTIFTRTRFIDRQGATAHVTAVEFRDRLVGIFLRRHLDEAEAARTAAEPVHDNLAAHDLAGLLEQLKQLVFGRVEREVPDEQFCRHCDVLSILPLRQEDSVTVPDVFRFRTVTELEDGHGRTIYQSHCDYY